MTKLQEINEHRERLGWKPLAVLPDLASHCDACGEAFDQKSLDWARCLNCLAQVSAVTQEQLRAWETQT